MNLIAGENVAEPFQLSDGTYVTQLIRYDLRFPELLRYPARSGAKIAFCVAQWPMSRLQHWHSLLKARAIENNMFTELIALDSMVTQNMLAIR